MKNLFRIYFSIILLFSFSAIALSQEGNYVFDFLRLPYSVRASALGGKHISTVENDPSMAFQNPGLLGPEMKGVTVNYLSYIAGINAASAIFEKPAGERSAWSVGVFYLDYGKIKEVTEENIILGDLNVKDICINAMYSHDLTERIRGGVTAKVIYSSFGEFSSIGLGVDLGLSYYNPDNDLSWGLTAKNLGGQVKAYHEDYFLMPWDIQFGVTQRLAHAPIRVSVTAVQLNRWKSYNLLGEKDPFLTNLAKHFIIGVDFIPTQSFWIAAGYNVKTSMDMSLEQGNKLGGFSVGAGFRVRGFEVGVAAAKYHPAATSLMVGLTSFF